MIASKARQKTLGAFYTPDALVHTLVNWAIDRPSDHLLDPACGDGRFLAAHPYSTGVELDPSAAVAAIQRVPHSRIHVSGFFEWAENTRERFDSTVGNPPFIRYQLFAGQMRDAALNYCLKNRVRFSRLTSSWAPFLVGAATLLRRGGRMAFVVPAEIGHAPYAVPLIKFLAENFSHFQLVAIREKIFPNLSEDAWLLYAEGYGGSTNEICFTVRDRFQPSSRPPKPSLRVRLSEWESWNYRLRPFLLSSDVRTLYQRTLDGPTSIRFGELANISIGYVTGANSFFHLRPSAAKQAGIPDKYLVPTVPSARLLPASAVMPSTVEKWLQRDEAALLLRLDAKGSLPSPVKKYLKSTAALSAQCTYKCRNRRPWYVVPDVKTPHAFLSYMSGMGPRLVANLADCVCSNSIHTVELKNGFSMPRLLAAWKQPLTQLSCEIEGHPLGGGMLKLEPREASRVMILKSSEVCSNADRRLVDQGLATMRKWRHYD